MKIIYFFKNLKPIDTVKQFLKQKFFKINKYFPKEETLIEVELAKNKEAKYKKGLYKSKIILAIPKKSLIIVSGVGKNIFQAIESSYKKLKRKLS